MWIYLLFCYFIVGDKMSVEYRKNQVKEKSTEIYTKVHTYEIDSLSYTDIDKINHYLTKVLNILNNPKGR